MTKSTSIPLDERSERFVEEQVSSGRYATAGEVVRAALEMMEERELKLAALRAAIKEGEESGEPVPLDRDKFFAQVRAEAQARSRNG